MSSLAQSSADIPAPEECPNCLKKDQQLEGLSLFVSNLAMKHESLLQNQKNQDDLMARLVEDRNKALRERDELEEKFDKATFAISS